MDIWENGFPDIYTNAELTAMGYFAQTTAGEYAALTFTVTSTCVSDIDIGFKGSGGRHLITIPAEASSQTMSVVDSIVHGATAFELRLHNDERGGTVGSCTITLQDVTLCKQ